MRYTEKEREAETQAEGEAGSMQGAGCRTQSWILGSGPQPKAAAQLLSHLGIPIASSLYYWRSLGGSVV